MRKIIFNEHQCRLLEANSNVAAVSERAIQYTPEFKMKAVKENLQGKGPSQIFVEHAVCPNLLNHQFKQGEPGKVFFTDITYLPNRSGQMAYLSTVKDVATREIVAYEVTTSLTMEIVYRTLKKLKEALDGNVHPEAMIRSDQGFHYTHPEYKQRVKVMKLTQSMSRRGNCIDNAPIESFFGYFKDDVDFKQATSLSKLKGWGMTTLNITMEHASNGI